MKKEQLFKTAKLGTGEYVRIEFDHWSEVTREAFYRVFAIGEIYLGVKPSSELVSFCR